MDAAGIAAELSSGGAYTAWFIVVALTGAVVYLYKETRRAHDRLIDSYREDDSEVAGHLSNIVRVQMETTSTLKTVLHILEGRR